MRIVGKYSFNNGENVVKEKYPHLLSEVKKVVHQVKAKRCKIKKSKEKTMNGRMLYSPMALNKEFKKSFEKFGWFHRRIECKYSTNYYINNYSPSISKNMKPFRDMDFVKEKLGVEVQFGKYAFMVYNIAAKMTIFHNLGIIDTGIEIVPVKEFANEMSTGVSYFEQFLWDLEKRGTSNIDIPVLIFGITSDEQVET